MNTKQLIEVGYKFNVNPTTIGTVIELSVIDNVYIGFVEITQRTTKGNKDVWGIVQNEPKVSYSVYQFFDEKGVITYKELTYSGFEEMRPYKNNMIKYYEEAVNNTKQKENLKYITNKAEQDKQAAKELKESKQAVIRNYYNTALNELKTMISNTEMESIMKDTKVDSLIYTINKANLILNNIN